MQSSIDEKMNEIIDLVLESEEYQEYKKAEDSLQSEHVLLAKYHRILTEYNEQRKYEKYIDLSSIKSELKEVQEEMNSNPVVVHYYTSLNKLNDMLKQITDVIFDGLLDPSLLQPYFK